MTTDAQTLAIREEQALAPRPREVIAGAKEQADALMDIVQARNLFATVGGKPYLECTSSPSMRPSWGKMTNSWPMRPR